MGLLSIDKWSEFTTRLSVTDVKAVVRQVSEDTGSYFGLAERMNKVDFIRLQDSAADDVFDLGGREDWSAGIQQKAALGGKPRWTLQVYVYDQGNHRLVKLRLLGNRDVVASGKRLAGKIEDAASR